MYTTDDTTSTHNTNHTHDRHNRHTHNIHRTYTANTTGTHHAQQTQTHMVVEHSNSEGKEMFLQHGHLDGLLGFTGQGA